MPKLRTGMDQLDQISLQILHIENVQARPLYIFHRPAVDVGTYHAHHQRVGQIHQKANHRSVDAHMLQQPDGTARFDGSSKLLQSLERHRH